ncbi:YqcC family protein [Vibrio metschnikovii]|uniref:YqcC family protein n=1 Tax=Vibrio metschnikovii TaxID=28172 RepID=UPI001C2F8350|nr:YqcC family protein [Vibrio metschnikovii]
MINPTHLPILLEQLTTELKAATLWQEKRPTEDKLLSREPFAIDTLHPHEWLQWIFLPRMWQLLEAKQPLPRGFLLTPYFVEAWKAQSGYQPLIEVLMEIDRVAQQC